MRGYYLAIKRNEFLINAATWINLKIIVLKAERERDGERGKEILVQLHLYKTLKTVM